MLHVSRLRSGSLSRYFAAVELVFLACALIGRLDVPMVQAAPEFTYYGHVPNEIWDIEIAVRAGHDVGSWRVANSSIRSSAMLTVVGNEDGTQVRVYALPERTLLKEFTTSRLEKTVVNVSNGGFFKVVTSKPATVMLLGGQNMELGQGLTTTFYTSKSGGYVGKEFIFVAVQGKELPQNFPGMPYRIYALEDSDVTVTDASGKQVASFKVLANRVRDVSLMPQVVHRVASTGYVMVQSFYLGWGWYPSGTCYYPSAKGGFVNTAFYGSAIDPGIYVETWGAFPPPEFIATSLEGSKLTIYDIENKKEHGEVGVAAASNYTEHIKVGHMAVESDKPFMLMLWNSGMTYAGVAKGQDAYIYIPTDGIYTGEAYLFAYKETTVTVDDMQTRLAPDSYLELTGGYHRLSATESVAVQVANWPRPSDIRYTRLGAVPDLIRLSNFAVCVPSSESLSMTYPDLNLKSVLVAELPWMYMAAGVVVVIVIAVLGVRMRRKPS